MCLQHGGNDSLQVYLWMACSVLHGASHVWALQDLFVRASGLFHGVCWAAAVWGVKLCIKMQRK